MSSSESALRVFIPDKRTQTCDSVCVCVSVHMYGSVINTECDVPFVPEAALSRFQQLSIKPFVTCGWRQPQ